MKDKNLILRCSSIGKVTLFLFIYIFISSQNNLFAQQYFSCTSTDYQTEFLYNSSNPLPSGICNYSRFAFESILLQPESYFLSSTNKSLHLKIQYDIDFSTMDPIGYTQEGDYTERNFNPDLNVGAIKSTFNVTPSGEATYQVPIYAPPGTAGMQPNIAIAYSSQSGNGLLGFGFDISGLSVITRIPHNIEDDGGIRPVKMDVNDFYAIDGNRLVFDGNWNGPTTNGSYYRTEVENFTKIKSQLNSNITSVEWFEVETKDGKIIEYGKTIDSRVYNYLPNQGDATKVIMWRINKITDRFGNYIEFRYTKTNSADLAVNLFLRKLGILETQIPVFYHIIQ